MYSIWVDTSHTWCPLSITACLGSLPFTIDQKEAISEPFCYSQTASNWPVGEPRLEFRICLAWHSYCLCLMRMFFILFLGQWCLCWFPDIPNICGPHNNLNGKGSSSRCFLQTSFASALGLPDCLWCILLHSFALECSATSPSPVPLQFSPPLASPVEQKPWSLFKYWRIVQVLVTILSFCVR